MMLVLVVQIVDALPTCKDSIMIDTNCSMVTPYLEPYLCAVYNYDIITINGTVITNNSNLTILEGDIYYFNFTEGPGDYIIRLCDGTTKEVIVAPKEDTMSSMAVVFFVTLITLGLFSLPLLIRKFTENEILNSLLKGFCIVLGLYLLSLDTAMVVTIAISYGLGVEQELFRFLWLIDWAAYIAMTITILWYFFKVISLWRGNKQRRRMGYE